ITFPALLDAYDRSQRDEHNEAALAAVEAIASLRADGTLNPDRAFFARFARPSDPLVRLRAFSLVGEAARTAWGDPLPSQTSTTPDRYLDLAHSYLAPPPGERDPHRFQIQTDAGSVEVELFADAAPLTVANFVQLARSGYFDGQAWPRVVPNF